MKIIFYSSFNFEDWDWTNSVEKGIGGSETSAVEMAWRLARRGYEVKCYAPVPWKGVRKWRGTTWTHNDNADFKEEGLWILYRVPAVLDLFGPKNPKQPRWLMCQDAHYRDALNEERAEKLDKVLALCPDHAWHLTHSYPFLKGTGIMWNTSNGVKVDLIREAEKAGVKRNPFKLIYASSPDRGLVTLLKIFKKAKQLVPELELHIFYGFHNIDKLTEGEEAWKDALIKIKKDVEKGMEQPGVIFRDRISQVELYKEWLSAGMWVYPTEFTETSCITSLEAQAMGAIPIFNPLWALRTNVGWGVSIDGNPYSDELVQARYVAEIVRMAKDEAMRENLRPQMMRWAREMFNWERWVDQWECEILGLTPRARAQFVFQHKHAKGRVLNVGCDSDYTGWLERGATNVDVRSISPVQKTPNRYHILHDARAPFPPCITKFDTVILGDIMEHIAEKDWKAVLTNCKNVLEEDGQIIITCPDDGDRDRLEQHQIAYGDEEYAPGCCAFHSRYISRKDIQAQLKKAGLKEVLYEPLDYSLFEGHAVIAKPIKKKRK